jgi:amino acid transporter/mannitol/fructose-specific phosphotransferase system IIA component (Ntr-type)
MDTVTKLKQTLGFWNVFCIASGAMVSSGLFVLPGQAFDRAGPAVVVSYAVAAGLMIPALLATAELSTAMPRSGGSYFFVERSLGALPGTLAGLGGWLSLALKSAFAMIGLGAIAAMFWPGQERWIVKAVAIGFCAVFAVANAFSVKATGRLQVLMVAGLLVVLAVFVATGAPAVRQHPNFDNFAGRGWMNILGTAGLVFISFGGLTKVAEVSEEIRDPGRTIPGGMLLAWGVVSLFYVAAVIVTVGVLSPDRLNASLTPLSEAAGEFLGTPGVVLLSIAAALAFATTGNSGILSASRGPMAMSRDGMLPPLLGKVSRRFGTPQVAVLATAAFMIVMIAALSIRDLVKVASTMMLILFLLMNASVLIMRGSRIQNYRPLFRMPFAPWLPLAGIVAYAYLIVEMALTMGPAPVITTGVFVAAVAVWYVAYVRPRITRESAIVYLVRRIVSRDMYRPALEEELKSIALERDEVVHDRFDRLVADCPILDIQESLDADEFFRRVSRTLAERLDMPADDLRERFERREAETSTVVDPGLAIPHVVVPGENRFDVVLVRCREGIEFPGHAEPVRIAFVLVGSQDQRNYHLRALMAIAHISQEHGFTDRWLAAPDAEHLRDIVLLSGRARDKPKG